MRPWAFGRHLAGALIVAGVAGASFLGAAAWAPQPALAQNPAAGIALTGDMVERFIASYDEMIAEAEALRERYDIEEDDGDDPGSAFLAFMAYNDAMGSLNGIASKYGFADFGEWVQVITSVAMAYAFASEGGAADESIARAISEIRNNPQIPEAQKDMMISQLQGGAMAMAAVRPSQENLDAVAPYTDELAAIFEND